MRSTYVIVGKPGCPWCQRAKDLLDVFRLDYVYIEIDSQKSQLREFLKAMGLNTVPQIWRDADEYIGDYMALEAVLNASNQLDMFDAFADRR